jgi:hypothetical protein
MALTGRQPAEIFFSARFSLPPKQLPLPRPHLRGPAQNPPCSRHQLRALPDPGPGRTKTDHPRTRSTPDSQNLRERRCRQHHHRPSVALVHLPRLRLSGQTLETRLLAFGLRRICCHKFKPKNQTDEIFLAKIIGHKLLGPNASLSVGQSYKGFYVV